MARNTQVGTHCTVIGQESLNNRAQQGSSRELFVQYHATKVVRFSDEYIVLNTGGFYSATTKTRMNQVSNQFDLGYYVYQKKGNWFVSYKGVDIDFSDGMRLYR